MGKVKEELLSLVEELMRECDERRAHEEILEQQVISLGGTPIPFEVSSPWHDNLDYYLDNEDYFCNEDDE